MTISRKPRLLFIYPFEASFITTDLDLLRSFCEVVPFRFDGKASYPALLKGIAKVDIVFSWFGLGFSAVANIASKALRRRSVVVSGGFDVTGLPEIGYGCLLTEWGKLRARLALSTADRVLAFSEWSARAIRDVAPKSHVRRAYLGVDVTSFHPASKDNLVISVAIISRENLVRKGLTAFVRAASTMPGVAFVMVGKHTDDAIDSLRGVAGPNIIFPGWLSLPDLRSLLARAKVYVQASYTEGFGVALAEAMASGCVPVVTRAGALPEVAGDAGIYFEYGDTAGLAAAITEALASDLGSRARQRVERRFSRELRLQVLHDAVFGALEGGPRARYPSEPL